MLMTCFLQCFDTVERQESHPGCKKRSSHIGPVPQGSSRGKLWTLQKLDATVQCCPRYISDIVQTTAASSRRQGLRSSTDTFSYTVPLTYTNNNNNNNPICKAPECQKTSVAFSKFGERAFSVAGPSVWNSLPADIRHITDISTFKRHLKTYLFNLYFNT